MAAFVTRLQPRWLPIQAARQLPEQSTTLRVAPTATGDTRIQGAVESRMGAVAWAMRQRSVSHPRSSNRTCRFPASGSPTGFTVRHTEGSLTTSVIGAACFFLRLTVQLSLKGLDPSRCLQALPITFTSPSSKTRQKSGSFPPPALPGLNSHTTLSDPRLNRRLTATLRPLPSPKTGLP
jgi:hypothetical protein